MIPAEPRLPDAMELIEDSKYFVIHAPRQTGKTTTLYALEQDLNSGGRHVALVVSCEQASAAGEDYGAAGDAILAQITAETYFREWPPEHMPPASWPGGPPEGRLRTGLTAWSRSCPLPIVLLLDEIDSLQGTSLISVLRQLRAGHNARTRVPFPSSVALCGMRQVRDYKAASGGNPQTLNSASPFNIAQSFRISDFTREQVTELLGQHTAETGQEFTTDAAERIFGYSQGQPWLVNALAYEITRKMKVPPAQPITPDHVDQAKERIILARQTHLNSLVTRLSEPRVKRFIEPIIAGTRIDGDAAYDDDLGYVCDLGLIARDRPLRVANPIYREVIVRVLNARIQDQVDIAPQHFIQPDGRLDFQMLLTEFAAWWRRNGEWLAKGEVYHEVAPQLIFMAFLQRVVNGGGQVDREYGLGTRRVDILVRKPYTAPDGNPAVQEEGIELKVRTDKSGDPLDEALQQLDGYLTRCGLDHGTLLIFDRRPATVRNLPDPEFTKLRSPEGRVITLLTA